jgi:ribonuclease HI
MFADDLLIFGQATTETMTAVREALDKFSDMSGHKVNNDKSAIFFSRNVRASLRTTLTAQSGFKETAMLGNYLGVPALGRTPRVNDFNYLVEKVKTSLAGWKAKQLSLAGRITLAKSVIQAIPIYPMMSMPIPKSCLHEIDKIQRAFIWGDSEEKKRMHLISWSRITMPKQCGGLGLRKLEFMNEACLMKMGWSLMVGEHSLWGQVLLGKYGRQFENAGRITTSQNDSALWKAIVRLWPKLEEFRCWNIGDGSQINFWTDKWIDGQLRLIDVGVNVPQENRDWKLKDIVNNREEWNFDMIRNILPPDILLKMHAILPPTLRDGVDRLIWPGNNSGKFTVKAAYAAIANSNNQVIEDNKVWDQIWHLSVMERIRVFVWQIQHGRLLTKQWLAKMKLGEPYCDNCYQFEESILHVLRDCPMAAQTWQHLLRIDARGNFFTTPLQDWIVLNLTSQLGYNSEAEWDSIWATTCYLLWYWRNKRTHDENYVSPIKPWAVVMEYVRTYNDGIALDRQVQSGNKTQVFVAWKAPPNGWCALNTDGAAKEQMKQAGCGGVLRDAEGRWIEGFAKYLGHTSAYMTELWGVYEGLQLARRRNIEKVEVQIDSQVLVHNLQNGHNGNIVECALMQRVKSLLELSWEVRITHVFREVNRCTDVLANIGSKGQHDIVFFENPPSQVTQVFYMYGCFYPQLINL